ncbi:nucleoside hydrolase [Acidicapsa acidisoli]|uniref:nucleoside hydrolase n=1 Tax=Acidicapsa acidisoli TaxID=1615681 RepID=UPI0021DFC545|nr:nucleoside hydrolase [Acidicapsa acidisoli]
MRLYKNELSVGKLVAAIAFLAILAAMEPSRARGQVGAQGIQTERPQLVWVDTDIGDDIDDAFALGLILGSPELHVLGISTAFGDTETRARLVDRFLAATSESAIPVTAGVHTETDNVMTQRAYAERFPAREHPDGVAALLGEIKRHPGEITLIAIGPLFNIGAAIDRDPETFRQLKRVVMMGGSVERGYGLTADGSPKPPDAEWNIKCDPKSAAKLFSVGVPIFMAPLDSTQIHLDAADREAIFADGYPLTDQLTLLYHQWVAKTPNHSATPTLFDPVAAAYTFRPELCPMQPIRIEVDDKGFTRKVEGPPNAQVCLKSDEDAFRALLKKRIMLSDKEKFNLQKTLHQRL